jgi:hypothetical protein
MQKIQFFFAKFHKLQQINYTEKLHHGGGCIYRERVVLRAHWAAYKRTKYVKYLWGEKLRHQHNANVQFMSLLIFAATINGTFIQLYCVKQSPPEEPSCTLIAPSKIFVTLIQPNCVYVIELNVCWEVWCHLGWEIAYCVPLSE